MKQVVVRVVLLETALLAGCGIPQDHGVVAGCFGFVNETIPGQNVIPDRVVTNGYFGGCSPEDPGMQIVERTTAAGISDQDGLVAACNNDCNSRLAAYAQAHPGVALPLSCQTLFAIPCDGLGADDGQLSAGLPAAFEAGGPADTRMALAGTVTIMVNGDSAMVPAHGIVDASFAACQGADQNCTFTLSRLDMVADTAFSVGGSTFTGGHLQNQGLAIGHRNAGEMLLAAGAVEAELSALVDGNPMQVHFTSSADLKSTTNLSIETFFSTLDVPMTADSVTVHIQMTGAPSGERPLASFTPQAPTYECQCAECTTVTFTSTASDPDNNLQSLSWVVDGTPQVGDLTNAPQTLDLSLPVGPHAVSLVATDTRGAAAASSLNFAVADRTPPTVTPPPNITLRSCDFPDIGRATAKDVCSNTVVVCSDASNFPVGTTTVTWKGEDASLNDGTARQTVTVTNVSDLRTCCPAGYNIIVVAQNNTLPVNGTEGNDCIIGTSNNDVINGLGGDDIIYGQGAQDTISGGPGNDVIFGGDGDDILDGGDGDDRIAGGSGQDRITGDGGNDVLMGGDGVDRISGGDGDDTIYGNQGGDIISGGAGNDFIDGGSDDDQIEGDAGDDVLVGCADNDVIHDTAGTNTIEGFTGDDRLTGGATDTLVGGAGHDRCTGGSAVMSCND